MIKNLFVLVVVSAIGLFVYQYFQLSDRAQIRGKLDAMVKLASVHQALSVLDVGIRAQKTSEYFAPNAVIELRHAGGLRRRFSGQKEIHDAVIMLAAREKPVELRLLDVVIEVAPGRTHAAAETRLQSQEPGNPDTEVFELKFNFEKFAKDWLITSVETLSPDQSGSAVGN